MRAIISVHDKTGVLEIARALHGAGVELVSTGGTFKAIQQGGLPVRQVSGLTGFPEILDGRVKTLHPHIHGGLLARRDVPEHMAQIVKLGIGAIDIVAVNLYPFVQTVSKPGVTLEDALENIDIGGPTLLRAAAKNYPHVLVVVDPADYGWIGERLAAKGGFSEDERRRLAFKAFRHTAVYDAAVSQYLGRGIEGELPTDLSLAYRKLYDLRYGENPHQKGALYAPVLGSGGVARAVQLGGKELSYNNLMDADAAWRTVQDFAECAVCVIKHTNPCGLAVHPDQAEAYRRAYSGDPVSAFGGILGFNRPVTLAAVESTGKVFFEVIVAPGYVPDALEALKKRANLRILQAPPLAIEGYQRDYRPISGGLLVQTPDAIAEDAKQWKVVTRRQPTEAELADLAFAWVAVKHIKSNAIVLARDRTLLGMGTGQPNRVTSVHLALRAAGEKARGSVLASDAFFPFPDNVELAAQGGVVAIAQPGGSIRDNECIAAADRLGIAMLFTGVRHFRH